MAPRSTQRRSPQNKDRSTAMLQPSNYDGKSEVNNDEGSKNHQLALPPPLSLKPQTLDFVYPDRVLFPSEREYNGRKWIHIKLKLHRINGDFITITWQREREIRVLEAKKMIAECLELELKPEGYSRSYKDVFLYTLHSWPDEFANWEDDFSIFDPKPVVTKSGGKKFGKAGKTSVNKGTPSSGNSSRTTTPKTPESGAGGRNRSSIGDIAMRSSAVKGITGSKSGEKTISRKAKGGTFKKMMQKPIDKIRNWTAKDMNLKLRLIEHNIETDIEAIRDAIIGKDLRITMGEVESEDAWSSTRASGGSNSLYNGSGANSDTWSEAASKPSTADSQWKNEQEVEQQRRTMWSIHHAFAENDKVELTLEDKLKKMADERRAWLRGDEEKTVSRLKKEGRKSIKKFSSWLEEDAPSNQIENLKDDDFYSQAKKRMQKSEFIQDKTRLTIMLSDVAARNELKKNPLLNRNQSAWRQSVIWERQSQLSPKTSQNDNMGMLSPSMTSIREDGSVWMSVSDIDTDSRKTVGIQSQAFGEYSKTLLEDSTQFDVLNDQEWEEMFGNWNNNKSPKGITGRRSIFQGNQWILEHKEKMIAKKQMRGTTANESYKGDFQTVLPDDEYKLKRQFFPVENQLDVLSGVGWSLSQSVGNQFQSDNIQFQQRKWKTQSSAMDLSAQFDQENEDSSPQERRELLQKSVQLITKLDKIGIEAKLNLTNERAVVQQIRNEICRRWALSGDPLPPEVMKMLLDTYNTQPEKWSELPDKKFMREVQYEALFILKEDQYFLNWDDMTPEVEDVFWQYDLGLGDDKDEKDNKAQNDAEGVDGDGIQVAKQTEGDKNMDKATAEDDAGKSLSPQQSKEQAYQQSEADSQQPKEQTDIEKKYYVQDSDREQSQQQIEEWQQQGQGDQNSQTQSPDAQTQETDANQAQQQAGAGDQAQAQEGDRSLQQQGSKEQPPGSQEQDTQSPAPDQVKEKQESKTSQAAQSDQQDLDQQEQEQEQEPPPPVEIKYIQSKLSGVVQKGLYKTNLNDPAVLWPEEHQAMLEAAKAPRRSSTAGQKKGGKNKRASVSVDQGSGKRR